MGGGEHFPRMGLMYNEYLNGQKLFGCNRCRAHLADHQDIISRVRSTRLNPSFHRAPDILPICFLTLKQFRLVPQATSLHAIHISLLT